jgi:hypothetical protein
MHWRSAEKCYLSYPRVRNHGNPRNRHPSGTLVLVDTSVMSGGNGAPHAPPSVMQYEGADAGQAVHVLRRAQSSR